MTGSPTDYVAEWKSGSALRQNDKKKKPIAEQEPRSAHGRAVKKAHVIHGIESVDVATFIGREITTVLKIAVDNVILELCDLCDYLASPLLV